MGRSPLSWRKTVDERAAIWYNMDMLAEKLRKIYSVTGADALLIESDYLRRYLIGFYATDGSVILDGESCRFVADLRYYEAARKALCGSSVEVVEGGPREALELVKPYQTLGVPFAELSLAGAKRLQDGGHTLVDCMPALRAAMMVKTPEELGFIQTACTIAEDAFSALLPQIKEGMAEYEVAALLEYEMRKRGASGTSFDTIVAFGANGSVPHHETGKARLKFGDPVLIDFGCKYEGYCSDCTRTFLFGDDKKHEKFKEIYAHVLEAHLLVLEDLRAGMTGREGDAIARDHLRKYDLAQYFTHSLGHGIGLLIHEHPVLAPRGEETLADGMVFSDEPGVYLAGELGVRIEDSVKMENGRAVSFMKGNKNLIIL